MKSQEMNDRIRDICDKNPDEFEAFGGKSIPYIGWCWRNVDFDREGGCSFGVAPGPPLFVGFMESNKWNYEYVHASESEFAEIKRLLVIAIETPNRETLGAVNDAVQEIGGSYTSSRAWHSN